MLIIMFTYTDIIPKNYQKIIKMHIKLIAKVFLSSISRENDKVKKRDLCRCRLKKYQVALNKDLQNERRIEAQTNDTTH